MIIVSWVQGLYVGDRLPSRYADGRDVLFVGETCIWELESPALGAFFEDQATYMEAKVS